MTEQRDYRDTVFLPRTSFPMRGDLPRKEPAMLARWDKMDFLLLACITLTSIVACMARRMSSGSTTPSGPGAT